MVVLGREKREEKAGKKVGQFDENRLVAKVVSCAKGWWKELENLRDRDRSGLMERFQRR